MFLLLLGSILLDSDFCLSNFYVYFFAVVDNTVASRKGSIDQILFLIFIRNFKITYSRERSICGLIVVFCTNFQLHRNKLQEQ